MNVWRLAFHRVDECKFLFLFWRNRRQQMKMRRQVLRFRTERFWLNMKQINDFISRILNEQNLILARHWKKKKKKTHNKNRKAISTRRSYQLEQQTKRKYPSIWSDDYFNLLYEEYYWLLNNSWKIRLLSMRTSLRAVFSTLTEGHSCYRI